jgi:hypothetical protein
MSETNYAPHIPDAVRRASARADELAREAGVANVPPLEDNGENTTVVNDAQAQFELTPPPDETQAPQPQAQPQTDWEQRYNTLQGKYNTELPELRGQLRSMQDMLATIQSQRAPETTFERPRPSQLPEAAIPQEDIESYGEDLINGVQRWSEAKITPKMAELERRLAMVEGGNQQLQSYTAQQSVDQALNRVVPDCDVINHDPNFIQWLSQVDMLSGQTRKSMIDHAYSSGDANRTIAFFRAYKNEQTVTGQTPGTQSFQTDNSAERLPLAELAVPGRGTSVPSPAPGAPERRIWTASQVNAFYRSKQRGQWAGREAEADRVERDIIAAPAEGRFRQ